MIKLFKVFILRSIKEHKHLIIVILLGCIISTSILSTTIFMIDNIENYIINNKKLLNHGNLAISQEDIWFGESQYNENNKKFEKYLTTESNIKYTFEQCLMPDAGSSINVEDGNIIFRSSYWYRFINFRELNRYTNLIDNDTLYRNNVILSETLAKRLSANKGNVLTIVFNDKLPKLQLKIAKIIPDNEISLEYANLGYLLIDISYYEDWVTLNNAELHNQSINIGQKIYYIDGKEDKLHQIETKAKEIYGEHLRAVYDNNIEEIGYDYFKLAISFLSLFTIICFILSGLSIINLVYLIIINRQKDIAVLKIHGLTNKWNIIFTYLEILLLLLPSYIFGIFIGYKIFRMLLFNTTTLGEYSITLNIIIHSIIKIFTINFLSILFLCLPLIFYITKKKSIDILRERAIRKKLKIQIFIISIFSVMFIYFVFKHVLKSVEINYMILILFFICFILYFCCGAIMRLFSFIQQKSYIRLSFSYLNKNKTRVPINIITQAFCFGMIFLMLLINYAINSMAIDSTLTEYDYNVECRVSKGYENAVEKYIKESLKVDNYYKVLRYNTNYQDSNIKFDIYDLSNYHGSVMNKKIKNGLNASVHFNYFYKLKKGSSVNIIIPGTIEPTTFRISNYYNSPFIGETPFAVALKSDELNYSLPTPDSVSYFLNISKEDKEVIINYTRQNNNTLIITAEDIVEEKIGEIQDYKYLFDIMTLYFLVCTFIVVFSCSIITYFNRIKEFCIYSVFGATKKMLINMILLENVLMTLVGSIFGIVFSCLSIDYISKILGLELQMNYWLIIILLYVFLNIALSVQWLIVKDISLQSLNDLIRDE